MTFTLTPEELATYASLRTQYIHFLPVEKKAFKQTALTFVDSVVARLNDEFVAMSDQWLCSSSAPEAHAFINAWEAFGFRPDSVSFDNLPTSLEILKHVIKGLTFPCDTCKKHESVHIVYGEGFCNQCYKTKEIYGF